jgi:hypothetical protein
MITTASAQELLARASRRQRIEPADARAGAVFERVAVGPESYFVKRLSPSSDWVMRIAGDHVHRPYLIWRSGLMGQAPDLIDHTVVTMDLTGSGDDAELTIVMRDVGESLVPPGDARVPADQHARFIAHMAALASAFWGWEDRLGLTTMAQRMRFFAPDNIEPELAAAEVPGPLAAAAAGWPALAERSPVLSAVARSVHDDPGLVTTALSGLPSTFVHGDWKMGNLGSHPDGRTILLDWTLPGAGPACWDLCWYLALNRTRLPESKQATIARFQADLERHGVETSGWFERQLDLCLAAIMVTFGWEKALGDEDELRWWEAAVRRGLDRQGLDLGRCVG